MYVCKLTPLPKYSNLTIRSSMYTTSIKVPSRIKSTLNGFDLQSNIYVEEWFIIILSASVVKS